jgi:hypothetical protein
MEIGTFFFLTNDELYQVIESTEKAIKAQPTEISCRTKAFWLPKSGMMKQPRHKLLTPDTPDTYKLRQWVKFN